MFFIDRVEFTRKRKDSTPDDIMNESVACLSTYFHLFSWRDLRGAPWKWDPRGQDHCGPLSDRLPT
jgi:hypothetical protein